MSLRHSSYQATDRTRAVGSSRLAPGATLVLSLAAVLGGAACGGPGANAAAQSVDPVPADMLPRFTEAGELVRPEGWEAWVLAGTSMGLTYDEPRDPPGPGEPPGRFLNVDLQPWAFERFRETGEFPEGTMFILAGAEPVSKADPARGGFYQGELSLLEVHLKREGLHESGWGFYGFGGGDAATARMIPGEAACYSCHRDEASLDHVFVQFYPPLRDGGPAGVPDAAGDTEDVSERGRESARSSGEEP